MSVNLAMTEIRRSPLRFGLLTAAVTLLVFLIVFLSSLSVALLRSVTGGLESLPADAVVYAGSARANLLGSRLEPDSVGEVASVGGVAAAGPVAVLTVTTGVGSANDDLVVLGVDPGSPGQPAGLTEGRFPSAPGEIAVDLSGTSAGLGDRLTVNGAPGELVVTGLLRGTQLGGDTAWMTSQGYRQLVSGLNPGLPEAPINAVVYTLAEGADPDAVAASVAEAIPGVEVLSRERAVAELPGVGPIQQTFGLLVAITFAIGVVVIGFFFLILTVQKLRTFTLLRATGASTRGLAGSVSAQISTVVLVACAAASLLAWAALSAMASGLPVSLDPATTLGTAAAVLIASLLAGLLSVRRIARIDPASAAGAR